MHFFGNSRIKNDTFMYFIDLIRVYFLNNGHFGVYIFGYFHSKM